MIWLDWMQATTAAQKQGKPQKVVLLLLRILRFLQSFQVNTNKD